MTTNKDSKVEPARAKGRSFRLHRAEHDPRAAALAVLSRVMFGNADSQAALDEALRSPSLVPTDKRLCTELVYGVLRRYMALESFAGGFLRKPDKLPGEMRLVLLLALYEMACLRIPHHASVGWAVGHVRNRFGQGLSKVANGALRAMQRALGEFANPRIDQSGASEEERLSRLFAVPDWIVRLWLRSYGPEAARILLDAAGHPAPVGLRLNRARRGWEQTKNELVRLFEPDQVKRADAVAATATSVRNGPDGPGDSAEVEADASEVSGIKDRVLHDGRLFLAGSCGLGFSGALPWQTRTLLKEGKASRQSAASYEALEAFEPGSWQLPIWDCCAGRGGKTLPLLEQGIAVEVASDPSAQRLNALPEEYARLGLANPPCPAILPLSVEEAAARLAEQRPSQHFGTILIDAPCSGLGTLSRRPEIRFRRTQADLDALAGMQKKILALAWSHLKVGGSLVYLTCTLNPAENEAQVADFLANHSDAEVLKEFRTDFSSPLREFFYGARIRKL